MIRLAAAALVGLLAAGHLPALELPAGWDDLGVPACSTKSVSPFGRNVWDLAIIGRELAVGSGNADNDTPSPNAGPIRLALWPLDTPAGAWRYVGADGKATFPEMQIDEFTCIDGTWWFAGMDPDLDWSIRTHYRREPDGTWRQLPSTMPDKTQRWGIHAYSLLRWGDALYSAGYLLGRSVDGGVSWTVPDDVRGKPENRGRVTHLLSVGEEFFAISEAPRTEQDGKHPARGWLVLQWVDQPPIFGWREDLTPQAVLPGAAWALPAPDNAHAPIKLARSLLARNRTWYLAGLPSSDHQTATLDVFAATSWAQEQITVLRCTPAGERPWDLYAVGDEVLLLTSRAVDSTWTASVWSLADDGSARLRCAVPGLPTFARALAVDGRDVYLGLGTDDGQATKPGFGLPSYTADERPDSGRILRGRGMLAGE